MNRMQADSQARRLVLALETSCDETSAAVVADGRVICSNVISSQVPLHRKYGGVVPEIASRKHIENIIGVIDEAMTASGKRLADLDAVAVTYGPGLVGALLVGVAAAKALAFALDVPLLGVNHLEGHIFANLLAFPELEPPFAALVVSGGHTSLVHVRDYNQFLLMGQTRDDAAGEAFDKIARVMGLPYPGGPEIERLAAGGNPRAIEFPRALAAKDNLEFSFSGLKSAVLNYLHNASQKGEPAVLADVAASFQASVVSVLVDKTLCAAEKAAVGTVVIAGGVAANIALKQQLGAACAAKGLRFFAPPLSLCTDNAAMIASRAYYQLLAGQTADLSLNAVPSLKLGSCP
ncbi:MAG: tRNA (adenosine(37)-N6)-threonylcarbamoyltransferase complex transferase subunit TsaD [Sporomusaceae bacterium]|nr:tRNA (adenosine(37)-N6)-threonylcarbamoyltransferase complex transferase subunit TsaD [Sporomusaceae bacterium]